MVKLNGSSSPHRSHRQRIELFRGIRALLGCLAQSPAYQQYMPNSGWTPSPPKSFRLPSPIAEPELHAGGGFGVRPERELAVRA